MELNWGDSPLPFTGTQMPEMLLVTLTGPLAVRVTCVGEGTYRQTA